MMNWKRCGRKWLWPNFKVLSQHLPGRTEEYHDKPQYRRIPCQDLNPGPPEEAGMLGV
jgi:hypothetical protein